MQSLKDIGGRCLLGVVYCVCVAALGFGLLQTYFTAECAFMQRSGLVVRPVKWQACEVNYAQQWLTVEEYLEAKMGERNLAVFYER